jgi:hypothetical protein
MEVPHLGGVRPGVRASVSRADCQQRIAAAAAQAGASSFATPRPTRTRSRWVYTLVNVVGPDDRLVGFATNNLSGIPAGKDLALGDDPLVLPRRPGDLAARSRRPGQEAQAHALKLPTITNIRIYPDLFRPDYVGSLSTVVFDANGNVLGGGSGYAFASLPPSAREFFKIERGLDAIPMGRAASAMVSAVGTYDTP